MALNAFQRRAAVAMANIALLAATTIVLPPIAQADGYVGAIAATSRGNKFIFGRTKNAPSKAAAESAALGACGYSDCKVLVTFTQCGAIAQNRNNDLAGGYGSTLSAAQSDAVAHVGGSGAIIATWYCNASS